MTHTDQSRAEFEAWYSEYHNDACDNYGGIDCTNPKGVAEDAWQAALNYAIASIPAETAPADAGLRDCGTPTTEQSSGVELPEPDVFIQSNHLEQAKRAPFMCRVMPSPIQRSDVAVYTEQQVRTLLAGVKESLTATGVPTATTGADCVTTGAAPMVQGCCIPIPAHSEYGSGIVTGKQVTLIFTNQGAAIAWMDGFCDAYDAANGTQSCSLPVPLPQPPKEQT